MEGVLCRPISGIYSGKDSLGIFSNNDHIQYYYNNYPSIPRSRKTVGVRCSVVGGGKVENMAVVEKDCATTAMIDEKKNMKMLKKRSKWLKRLSEDLAMLSLAEAGDGLILDNQEWKENSEALLSQLKKLKSEQKELKKKMKEKKAKSRATNCTKKIMKLKTKAADCASTSSSSSSSESSDSECEREILDMSRRKHEANMQVKEDLHLQLAPTIQEKAVNQENNIEQDSSNILLSLLEKEKEATEKRSKKIEVCMGGKCKRSGAGALLEEFQKVAGADMAVVGCKCMGKCRDGPNVRLVSPPAIDSFDHDNELLHHSHRQVAVVGGGAAASTAVAGPPLVMARRVPKPSYPLCIGVGLDDVSFIVSKFVGDSSGVAV